MTLITHFKSFFNLRVFLIAFLFILAIALTCWSIFISRPAPSHKFNQRNHPDAFMEEITAIIFNKSGLPSLKIQAPKMIHYQSDDSTHIREPHVTFFRDSTNPWDIRSFYGETQRGVEQIIFSNHVVIHHVADKTNPTTTLTTNSLTIFPDQKLATTTDPILITQPNTTVHAIGMTANLNNGIIKLLSEAKGEYAPS